MNGVDLSWTLTWDGETWSFADLATSEVALLSLELGDEWKVLSPLSSQSALMTHVALHVALKRGEAYEKVQAEIATAPFVDLLAALDSAA